jgi:hypothetical protein
MSTSLQRNDLIRLHRLLERRFSVGELSTLCFYLGLDYDDLPEGGKSDKARELIQYLDHRDLVPDLVALLGEMRPDISWHGVPEARETEEVWIPTREASELTGYGQAFLRRLAKRWWVRACRDGRNWLFDREIVWLHSRDWLSIREAGDLTGYSDDHLRSLARDGLVRARKVRGLWLLYRKSLLGYCRRQGRKVPS